MTKTRFKDQFFRFRMLYSGDETCNVGKDEAFPVSPDYGPRGNQYIKANNIRPWK
jgi:hypothetical protein